MGWGFFACAVPSLAGQDVPAKRALVVAIGDYPDGSGYTDLSSANDVALVRGALMHQGFADDGIRVLADADADREGLEAAIRAQLIEPARPGDILFFHYSGHGHRITDDDGDEPDGYDEVLVPWDARADADPYADDRHFRDDDLNELVMEMRRRAGSEGNVVVSLDACNSGSATRGLAIRGSPDPIGPPAPGRQGGGDEGGGLHEAGSMATRGGSGAAGLAPYIVLSAARHDEPAREVRAEDGTPVGSLSFALGRAFPAVGAGATYRTLFDHVKAEMAALVPLQTPQMEGDADTEVFSGRLVEQTPYFRVMRADGDTAVVLTGGSLVGLLPGTVVDVLPVGAAGPGDGPPLATGNVVAADPMRSLVRLDAPAVVEDGWAFVRSWAAGELAVGVSLDGALEPALAAELRAVLDTVALAVVRDTAVDLTLVPGGGEGTLVLRAADDDRRLAGPFRMDRPEAPAELTDRLRSLALSRYLARVELQDPTVDVKLEIVPAAHDFGFDGSCTGSEELPAESALTAGGQWTFVPGDGFLLRLRNEGRRPAYLTVLSLTPDGGVSQLFPLPELSGQDNLLAPGQTFTVDLCYSAAEPYGAEILKLFATRQRVDFWPILEGTGPARSAEELTPLERLLADVQSGTRSSVAAPPRTSGTTRSVAIHIVPQRRP